MEAIQPADAVSAFTLELLRTGTSLSDLASELIEALPNDAYPGEEPAAVVVEMLTGTIRTSVGDADTPDLRRATGLIAAARERVIEHLQLALELSRRVHGPDLGGPRRTYG